MPIRRAQPRGPGRARRALALAGVVASVLLNVWAVAASGNLRTSTPDAGGAGGGGPAATVPTGGPTSVVVTQKGDGTFTVVPVPGPTTPPPTSTPAAARGRTVRYTVEVEGGLAADREELAATVAAVLTDTRGWETKDGVRFVNVSPAQASAGAAVDVHVSLASPDTTDRLCAPLETRGQVSCHNGGRVVLNLRRWLLGADAYGADLAAYRTYLVNHEVGHALGHGHASCPGKGQDAPIMMQQTYGLDGCLAWPWPTARTA